MKITLSDAELEDIVYCSLCNAVGTGYMAGYGLKVDLDALNYDKYREEGDCYEEVMMKALRAGEAFHVIDEECEGEYNASFTLAEAKTRLSVESISDRVLEMINEQDDAVTADCILQTALYEEIIFG